MSGENDPTGADGDPIDAQFEPAPPAADYVEKPIAGAAGPGWIALGVTGLLATILGAGLGAQFGQGGGAYAPATLIADVQEVAEDQMDQDKRVSDQIAALEGDLRRGLQTATAARGDAQAVAALTSEVEALNERLEALDISRQEAGEAETYDMAELYDRIEALEQADEEDVKSPRIANRAITVLRRRLDEVEEARLVEQDERVAMENALLESFSQLEARLGDGGTREAGTGAGASPGVIADLRADIEALQTASDAARTAQADNERLARWVEELREREAETAERVAAATQQFAAVGNASAAALAMLSIEAAAREGRPFQSAFAQLDRALPDNAIVTQLKPLAAQGAPTLSALQTGFAEAREAAAGVAVQDSDSRDGWGWVRRTFGDDVQIRRSGETDDIFEGIMDEAAGALERRDLIAAISAVETLGEARGEVFADWLVGAAERRQLEEALDTLRLALMNSER